MSHTSTTRAMATATVTLVAFLAACGTEQPVTAAVAADAANSHHDGVVGETVPDTMAGGVTDTSDDDGETTVVPDVARPGDSNVSDGSADIASDASMDTVNDGSPDSDLDGVTAPEADASSPGPDTAVDSAVCAPGETQCAGLHLQACSSDGSLWVDEPCPALTACADGTCQKVVCPDAELLCQGDQLHACVANGTKLTLKQDCAATGAVCKGGACETKWATDVGTGGAYACALRGDGTIACWGFNQYGQLGNGSGSASPVPVAVPGVKDVVKLGVGFEHACAITKAGFLKCWGRNDKGQVGVGSAAVEAPTTMVGLAGVVDVDGGVDFTCAVLVTGTVHCWGEGKEGQLGNGAKLSSKTSVQVKDLTTATAVQCAYSGCCALLADKTVSCWGTVDVIGVMALESQAAPLPIEGVTDIKALAAGAKHVCALAENGKAKCWGFSANGQLGNGKTGGGTSPPVELTVVPAVAAIGAGYHYTCLIVPDGTTKCFGLTDQGQAGKLGASLATPTTVVGLADAVRLDGGYAFACALTKAGHVYCWGSNEFGQLGDGDAATKKSSTPKLVKEGP